MKIWHFVLVGLLLSIAAGCRTDPARALLERELRRKEDEIYRLRWELEDLRDTSSCSDHWQPRDASPAAAPSTPAGSTTPGALAPPTTTMPSEPSTGVPKSLLPDNIDDVPEHIRGPSGPILEKSNEPPAAHGGNNGASAMAPLLGTPINPNADSRQAAAVALNHALTGGLSGGDGNGDVGLMVVVEPRDADGRSIAAPADVTVVALDPAVTDAVGQAVPVAKWEYTAEETAELFRRSGAAQAMYLTMGWHGKKPAHKDLHLFIRYETADGRQLQTDMPITVALSGNSSSRWSPTDLDRTEQRIPVIEARRPERPPVVAAQPEPTPTPAKRPPPRKPKTKRPAWSPDRP